MSQEMDEAFWVDFVEGELDPSLKEDMRLLLSHSEQHRDVVYGIENVKAALKMVDDVEVPQDGNYYLAQHDKIMSEIANVKVEPPRRVRRPKWAKLPQYLMMFALFALAFAVASSIFLSEKGPENHIAKDRVQEVPMLKAALPVPAEDVEKTDDVVPADQDKRMKDVLEYIQEGSDPN